MRLLYLGYFSTPEIFHMLYEAGLEPSEGRQNYDISLINNLLSGQFTDTVTLDIISYLPHNEKIGRTPNTDIYRGQLIQYVWTSRTEIAELVRAIHKIDQLIKQWLDKTADEERIILTYAANPILLSGIMHRKKRVKIVTICSEVPKYRNMTEGNPVINKLKKAVFSYFNDRMDGYIYMSKYMNEVCNPQKRPWIVVEGMTEIPRLELIDENAKDQKEEIIFYAGGLHVENGIGILLEAVAGLDIPNVFLQLCGVGNAVDLIKQYAKEYSSIQYLGSVTNSTAKILETKATLLINPRKPDFMLTKFSFPSKTFEYFSSGTACVLTKLDGIPDEFYQYCYTCDVSSAERLRSDLRNVLRISQKERKEKAMEAYAFLKREKSAEAQTKKIMDFLCSISKDSKKR